MNYEFVYEEDFLIIKLSGSAEVNERLLAKESLTPYLQRSHQKVIIDLENLAENRRSLYHRRLEYDKERIPALGWRS